MEAALRCQSLALGSALRPIGKTPARYRLRSLESFTLQFLKSKGLHAKSFKAKRGGEEYEFDVVLAWDAYVFVLECKNQSLSGNRPIKSYYFDVGIRSHIKQVKRLANSLTKYPDILQSEMSIDVAGKTIIPCVLNSLPYARNGDVDGVYCTDSSILERFFSQKYLFVKSPHRIDKKRTILHRTAITSFWASDRPSPEDFLRQLRDPFQVKILRFHTEIKETRFSAGNSHAVSTHDYVRVPSSMESVCAVFGVSGSKITHIMQSVAKKIKKLKKKIARKK